LPNPKSGANDRLGLQPQRDVAVYLDFENLYVSLKTTAKMDPNFDLLMEKCREFGRVTLARAYADWSEFARMFTSQMFANGIEPVYVPTRTIYGPGRRSEARKNSVDIHITIDIVKSLFLHENVDVIILISGDRDYVPLINQIRQRGKSVYAIGVAGCTSSELSIAVDEMFFYHQIVESETKAPEKVDVYNSLLRAIRIAHRRGYPTTLGILKPIMKELVEGFDERKFQNARGVPFQKFKDLVEEAQRRHLVRLVTTDGSIEVMLWADAAKAVAQQQRERGDRPEQRNGPSSRPTRRRRPSRGVAATADERTAIDEASREMDDASTEAATPPPPPAEVATVEPEPDDERAPTPSLLLDDSTWETVRRALATFEKAPTPRRLITELRRVAESGAFGDSNPSDGDLDALIRQCVDAGRLRRQRRGFATVLRVTDSNASETTPTEAIQ